MRILYEGMIYERQWSGGISRYFAEVIKRLPDWITPVVSGPAKRSVHRPHHDNLRLLTPVPAFVPRSLAVPIDSWHAQLAGRVARYDLIHPTDYSSHPQQRPDRHRRPIVVTVYDMLYERYPKALDPTGRMAKAKRHWVEVADAIICISEWTRRDLLRWYPEVEGKTSVVPLATSLAVAPYASGREPVPEGPYFLYVGNRGVYKNITRLLVAFKEAASGRPDLRLVLVSPSLNHGELSLLDYLEIEERVLVLPRVDDELLARLYAASLALVFPSLSEGFGLPPLEAMGCGTLVVASDASSVPEVCGDAALLVDGTNVGAIAAAMRSISDGQVDRPELLARGRRQASRFSWNETTARTVEVYGSLAANERRSVGVGAARRRAWS